MTWVLAVLVGRLVARASNPSTSVVEIHVLAPRNAKYGSEPTYCMYISKSDSRSAEELRGMSGM